MWLTDFVFFDGGMVQRKRNIDKQLATARAHTLLDKGLTYRVISKLLCVPIGTLYRWVHMNMSSKAVVSRKSTSSSALMVFTRETEDILCGWLLARNLAHKSTATSTFRKWIGKYFLKSVSPTWITRFCKRHHFSVKKAARDEHRDLELSSAFKAIDFLKTIRQEHLSPGKIIVIDKTALKGIPARGGVKHISPIGR